MKDKVTNSVVVFLLLTEFDSDGKQKILLQKRKNTEFADNKYDFCVAGHLREGESLIDAIIRESKEEIGITIKEENLKMIAISQCIDARYIRFYFKTEIYEGKIRICEPNKCSEIIWADIKALPSEIAEHTEKAIENIIKGNNYFLN